MENRKEWLDRTHEIADRLESEANKKCTREIEKAKAYCDGYIKGVEDYAREMRNNIQIQSYNPDIMK